MNILFVADVYAWSLANIVKGYSKYSVHKVDLLNRVDFFNNIDTIEKYNIVVFMLWGDLNQLRGKVEEIANKYNIKFVVGLWTDSNPDYGTNIPSCVKAFVYGDRKVFEKAKTLKDIIQYPKYLLREAVDHNLFVSNGKTPESFKIGWAGNFYRENKRTRLLTRIGYDVEIITPKEWHDFLHMLDENQPQSRMVDWYNSLNCYVYVSDIEGGQSTTILEAMSCGLSVVATRAGAEMSYLLDSRWLVPTNPEEEVISEMHSKLIELERSSITRDLVGSQNRERILEDYTWEKRTKEYDKVFEEIYNG